MCEIDIGGQICKQIDRDSGKRGERAKERVDKKDGERQKQKE